MHKLKLILVFVLICFTVSGFAQKSDTIKYISVSAKYSMGYIYAHHQFFKYFVKDYVPAFELNVGFRKKGNKTWHQIYKYPTLGFGYYHAELGNPEILGHVDAVFPYIEIPVIEKNKFKLDTKLALGIAWLNKKFDLHQNKYNIAIGSKLNVYINVNIESKLKLNKQISLLTGLGITHYSNGGTRQPNKGINVISASAGLLYNFQKDGFKKIEQDIPKFKKRNEYSFIFSAGTKTLESANQKQYLVSIFSFNAERQYSRKGMFGIGIDFFKDNSRKEYLRISESLILKTFWADADFIEFGIGYRF